jgi:hypothetical protein
MPSINQMMAPPQQEQSAQSSLNELLVLLPQVLLNDMPNHRQQTIVQLF